MDFVDKVLIHQQSIAIAGAFAFAYERNMECAEEILEAAKAIRRELPKGSDGKRFGHREFWDVTQSARTMRASV